VSARHIFGLSLRRQREQRGIPLEAIASAMKVSTSLLAGLERGDCARWPGGIYSRAYVRDYARAIGLEPSEVAARFAELFSETAHPDGVPPEAASVLRADRGEPPPLRLTLALDSADRADAVLRRARLFVIDLALVLAVAASVSTSFGRGFWIALAAASLTCHAIAILRGAPAAASLPAAPFHSSTVHESQTQEPRTESVAAEAT
jgi:transcriptional regulator with XRE-family HTH domain